MARAPPPSVPSPPPPDTVAAQFTEVYYGVASSAPERLAELFGGDSEMSHAAGVSLSAKDIPSSAHQSPLAKKKRAVVTSLDAMHTANGGYVVLVTGTLEGNSFTQTFVLASAGDEKAKGHFYCRNDIFRFVQVASGKNVNPQPSPSTPGRVLVPEGAQPVQVASSGAAIAEDVVPSAAKNPGGAGSPASIAAITAGDPPVTAAPGQCPPPEEGGDDDEDSYDEEEDESEEDEDEKEVTDVSTSTVPNNADPLANSTASPSVTPSPAAAPVAATSEEATGAAASDSKPPVQVNGASGSASSGISSDAPSSETPVAKSETQTQPPAPKSWASIVSASSTPASTAAPAAATTTSAVSVPVQGGGVVDQTVSKPIDATGPSPAGTSLSVGRVEAGGSARHASGPTGHNHVNNAKNDSSTQSSGSANAGGWSSVDNKRHSHSANDGGYKTVNGHHSGYHSKHNQARVYGPSAVIQLVSIPNERVTKDVRTLQNDFSTEFSQYGQVCNVEVKVHKGLAFVEYLNSDAVRAAVAAWADGARDSGPFKGVPLAVSEKRQRRHIPGGEHPRGGNRGAMRGGGRGAGGGRGRGRGMPMNTGGGAGVHSSSSSGPTAASS